VELYEQCSLYDVAFSYRDIRHEVEVLTAWYAALTGRPQPASVLELAAGPARHALEFSRRGAEAWGLDASATMSGYARALAAQQGLALTVITEDMTAFEPPRRFDMALLMLDSVCHILTMPALERHLSCVARGLVPGGVYVMEVGYPTEDEIASGEFPRQWRAEQGDTAVEVHWGRLDDPYDRPQRIRTVTMELRAQRAGRSISFTERFSVRSWTQSALDEAIQRCGAFSSVRRYGALELNAPFEPTSWRMVYVLQR
jgi:SAM-dependent methyltransferase